MGINGLVKLPVLEAKFRRTMYVLWVLETMDSGFLYTHTLTPVSFSQTILLRRGGTGKHTNVYTDPQEEKKAKATSSLQHFKKKDSKYFFNYWWLFPMKAKLSTVKRGRTKVRMVERSFLRQAGYGMSTRLTIYEYTVLYVHTVIAADCEHSCFAKITGGYSITQTPRKKLDKIILIF